MKRFYILLSAILSVFVWISFAANPTILNHSYTVEWNEVKIFWTDNSNWWNVDIKWFNPNTKKRVLFGTVNISDQNFSFTKQRQWDQKILMIPNDWWDEIQFHIETNNENITRTVIPAVPKTWPSGNAVGIIFASIMIFWGYIFIKKRADI